MIDIVQDYETFFGPVPIPGEFTGKRKKKQKMLNLSLRNPKISYTDYVRHPEFEVLGVSLQIIGENAAPFFVHGDCITDVYHELGETYGWENIRLIAHNAIFEGLINYEQYGVVPGKYFCTQAANEMWFQGAIANDLDTAAHYLLDAKKLPWLQDFKGLHLKDLTADDWIRLSQYANNDVFLTRALFAIFVHNLPAMEQDIMSDTIMLFANPILEVDLDMAKEALHDAITERDALVARTGCTVEQISGNITFEAILRDELGWVPTKINKNGEVKQAFSKTDLEFIKLKSHPDARVRDLVEARQEVKSSLGLTRAQRLIDLGTQGTRRLPVCLHYARAHTMRWTGGNKVNLQNLTRGSKLRRSIVAPEGKSLVVVDSSQIECRTLASLAGQEDLLDIFRTGGDPYNVQAMSVFGADVPFAKDSDERFLGKTAVLGLGYGMGANKFYNEVVTGARGRAVNITREFARETVRDYRYNNQDILTFWDLATDMLDWMVNGNGKREYLDGMIVACAASKRLIFPNGCFLRYNELCNSDGDFHYQVSLKGTLIWKKIYGGMLVENIVQAIARHVVAEQIHEIGKRYRLVLFVHDECVYCVLVDEADEALQYGLAKFRINPSWTDIPLDAEGGHAREYSK